MDDYTTSFLVVVSLVAFVGLVLILLTLKEPTPKKT